MANVWQAYSYSSFFLPVTVAASAHFPADVYSTESLATLWPGDH